MAVTAALKMVRRMKVAHMNLSIGVTTGPAFCGTIGSRSRREYVVVGDTINTAARLMGRASKLVKEHPFLASPTTHHTYKDHIVCDDATVSAVRETYEVRSQTRMRILFRMLCETHLKGKKKPLKVYHPYKPEHIMRESIRDMLGSDIDLDIRKDEMNTLAELITRGVCHRGRYLPHLETSPPLYGGVILRASAGFGKAAIMAKAAKLVDELSVPLFISNGRAEESNTPYAGVQRLLVDLLFVFLCELRHVSASRPQSSWESQNLSLDRHVTPSFSSSLAPPPLLCTITEDDEKHTEALSAILNFFEDEQFITAEERMSMDSLCRLPNWLVSSTHVLIGIIPGLDFDIDDDDDDGVGEEKEEAEEEEENEEDVEGGDIVHLGNREDMKQEGGNRSVDYRTSADGLLSHAWLNRPQSPALSSERDRISQMNTFVVNLVQSAHKLWKDRQRTPSEDLASSSTESLPSSPSSSTSSSSSSSFLRSQHVGSMKNGESKREQKIPGKFVVVVMDMNELDSHSVTVLSSLTRECSEEMFFLLSALPVTHSRCLPLYRGLSFDGESLQKASKPVSSISSPSPSLSSGTSLWGDVDECGNSSASTKLLPHASASPSVVPQKRRSFISTTRRTSLTSKPSPVSPMSPSSRATVSNNAFSDSPRGSSTRSLNRGSTSIESDRYTTLRVSVTMESSGTKTSQQDREPSSPVSPINVMHSPIGASSADIIAAAHSRRMNSERRQRALSLPLGCERSRSPKNSNVDSRYGGEAVDAHSSETPPPLTRRHSSPLSPSAQDSNTSQQANFCNPIANRTIPGTLSVFVMELHSIPKEDIISLICKWMDCTSVDERLLHLLTLVVEGNASYLRAVAERWREDSVLSVDKNSVCVPNDPSILHTLVCHEASLSLPSSVLDCQAGLIDSLDPSLQMVVKVASCIGRVFTVDMLLSIYPVRDSSLLREIPQHVEKLSLQGLFRSHPQSPGKYSFVHRVTQTVVHNRLPIIYRLELHTALSKYFTDRKSTLIGEPSGSEHSEDTKQRISALLVAYFHAHYVQTLPNQRSSSPSSDVNILVDMAARRNMLLSLSYSENVDELARLAWLGYPVLDLK